MEASRDLSFPLPLTSVNTQAMRRLRVVNHFRLLIDRLRVTSERVGAAALRVPADEDGAARYPRRRQAI